VDSAYSHSLTAFARGSPAESVRLLARRSPITYPSFTIAGGIEAPDYGYRTAIVEAELPTAGRPSRSSASKKFIPSTGGLYYVPPESDEQARLTL